MIWQFTCYNGTIWDAPHSMLLTEAVDKFCKETGLTQLDIKIVFNIH